MKKPTLFLGLLLLAALSRSIAGQAADTAVAETPRIGPPIRQISTASAVSTERIGSILGVRELPDGRVLVNDGASRRLLLLDTMLVLERVVLDSLSERENTYGTEQGILVAHRGDSTLFIDPESLAMLVIDPAGNVVRVRSVPRAQDLFRFRTTVYGNPATDAHGRLVYRMYARPAPPTRPPPRGVPWIPQEPDSAFIVGLDIDERRLDTLGVIRIPTSEYRIRARQGGGFSFSQARNPMPISDLWAVLPGGGVAFVRAIDYHVDYLNADGSWTSSGKIPYDWQPVSEEEKRRLVDSVQAVQMREARNAYTTSVIRYVNTYRRDYPPNFTAPEGYVPPNGFLRSWTFPPGVSFPSGTSTGALWAKNRS